MIITAEIVAIIAAAIAVFAAVLAVRATALVARTVLANQKEDPPRDPVAIRVTGGDTRRDLAADTREYAFEVAVTNRTGADRRFEPPTLRVAYRTRANFLGAVDISASEPMTVAAGETTSASLRFRTSNVIPRHCRIDAYTLLLIDSEGARIAVDASVPSVLKADTDGEGSRTWGYD